MKKHSTQQKPRTLRHGVTLFVLLTITACSNSGSYNVSSLAPLPPNAGYSSSHNGVYNIQSAEDAQRIAPAAGRSNSNHQRHWQTAQQERAVLAAKSGGPVNCSVKDRFDRNALLAYEFGTEQRNRVSFDVDGLSLDNTELEAMQINFTYRLQADKPKKQRCRYTSNYQGLVGSGYNELFLREGDNTVWHEIKDVRHEVEDRLGI
jgi:hypothetical protein